MNIKLVGAVCALGVALAGNAQASPCNAQRLASTAPDMAGVPITLARALSQIRHASPQVRAAALEARALVSDTDQAGRRLNPTLSIDLEDFGGSRELSGFNQSETTVSLSQTLQLGGKRQRSKDAARARAALGSADCAVILRETELQAAILYYRLVAAAETARLGEDSARLARELQQVVARRVEAGAATPPDLLRATTAAGVADALAASTAVDVNRVRYELAALWGATSPTFEPPSSTDAFNESIQSGSTAEHPLLRQARASLDVSQAQRRLARANRVPDVTVSLGYRRAEGINSEALVAGISVPLPLFDRNRDAIRASQFRAAAREADQQAIETRLLSEERSTIAEFSAAQAQLTALEDQALPAARDAYQASLQGYSAGKFDLTTTLTARQDLINVELSVIDARTTLNIKNMRLRALRSAAPFSGGMYER